MKSRSSILSIISICLSVGIILIWIFSNFKLEIIDLSTFIGASVGLIAIMVTFAIGYQIYNTLELKEKIKEEVSLTKDEINSKMQDLIKEYENKSLLLNDKIKELNTYKLESLLRLRRLELSNFDSYFEPLNIIVNNGKSEVVGKQLDPTATSIRHHIIVSFNMIVSNIEINNLITEIENIKGTKIIRTNCWTHIKYMGSYLLDLYDKNALSILFELKWIDADKLINCEYDYIQQIGIYLKLIGDNIDDKSLTYSLINKIHNLYDEREAVK